jgi:hypothetical protein
LEVNQFLVVWVLLNNAPLSLALSVSSHPAIIGAVWELHPLAIIEAASVVIVVEPSLYALHHSSPPAAYVIGNVERQAGQ